MNSNPFFAVAECKPGFVRKAATTRNATSRAKTAPQYSGKAAGYAQSYPGKSGVVINSEAAKIEQLQINEQTLLKAIEEAERAAQQRPTQLAGLSKLKGKLIRPADGRLRKLFGKRRQGQVRWKGILIDSSSGSQVRTVHDGKVLYADWLRGFGLVAVVDHGKGYMSLYGHNQALLKQAGDAVQAGETIALVGQSGGQQSPNLYFEIRHKGKPVNPSAWLSNR